MNRSLLLSTIRLCAMALLLGGNITLSAQDLKQPTPGFTDACASGTFNSFNVSFEWVPTQTVAADNQFVLELSDKNGSFATPTTLKSFGDKNTTYAFTFNFSFPENVAGSSYKVRVRSTNPAKTSPESVAFGAYYVSVNEPLIVNNFQEASVCENETIILEVDNYPGEAAYNWYKDMVLIPGEKSATLEVNTPGIYFAEIDYGAYCSVSTASNLVEVFETSSLGFDLMGESKISLCDQETYTLKANMEDALATYYWYKDGVFFGQSSAPELVISASDPNFAGVYYAELQIDGAGCTERSKEITIEGSGFDLELQPPASTVLLPGETTTLQVTTTAEEPSFQWYRNGNAISGATSATLAVDAPGTYSVQIETEDGCTGSKTSQGITIDSPQSYAVTIAAPDYTSCESGSATIAVQAITAKDSQGNTLSLPSSYWSTFSYQWVFNGNVLTAANAPTYTVSGSNSGMYKVEVTSPDELSATSNALEIQLGIQENLQISATSQVYCSANGPITIQSSVTNPDYTYSWYKNGAKMSANAPTLETNLTGSYQVEIAMNGCTLKSSVLDILPFEDTSVSLNVGEKTLLAEGETREIIASGADSYQWFNAEMQLLSSGPSISLSQEGVFHMKAVVNGCEVVRTFELAYQVSTVIPNVITANGDGFNDLWVLPAAYAYQSDVTVKIYEQSGVNVLDTNNYQNNWPEASAIAVENRRPPVYYYTISKGKDILKRGTITVLK